MAVNKDEGSHMERVGHPHMEISITHRNHGLVSYVYKGNELHQSFVGQNSKRDARRHANVLVQHHYYTQGNPNGDAYKGLI
jgi:hypothetical protein